MTPPGAPTLIQLGLTQEVIPLFRNLGALDDAQRRTVQALIKRLSTSRPLASNGRVKHISNPMSPDYLVEWQIHALNCLSSPIRHLPPEILVEIFRLYLVPDTPGGFRDQRPPSPFDLCSVCYSWRALVASNASLWSQLRLRGQGDFDAPPEVHSRHAEAFTASINRIGDHIPWSLSIELDQHMPGNRGARVPLPDVLRHPATSRLQALQINSQSAVTGLEGHTFPALESLLVRWTSTNNHIYSLESVFPTVPRLTKLVVVNVVSLNPSTDKLPWSNLTHLFIESISLEKFRAVLVHCTSLREGCFSLDEPTHHMQEFMSVEGQRTLVTFPHLTRLTFFNRSPLHNNCQQLHFPALEDLNLVFGDYPVVEWSVPATLHAFRTIRRLSISGKGNIDPRTTVFRLLEAAPLITDLYLDIVTCDDNLLLKSVAHDPSTNRLQILEHLDISVKSTPTPDIAITLQDLLRSRSPQAKQVAQSTPLLQKFTLRVPKSTWAPDTLLCINAAARPLGFDDSQVSVLEETRPFPLVSPPDGNSGGYRHWDEGLMDFIIPSSCPAV